jgi:antitoxin (DNA-binding transcriptional repressor) of toxin-antitoxin stability system
MDGTITEQELAQHFGETLDRVRLRGERLTIDREGKPIAILSPAETPVTWLALADVLARVGLPGDGFADDLEAAQNSQPLLGGRPPSCRHPETPSRDHELVIEAKCCHRCTPTWGTTVDVRA